MTTDQSDSVGDASPGQPSTIDDLASVVRSKNAGPFRLTLDIFFDTQEHFDRVVATDAITPSVVADVYGIDETAVLGIYELDRIPAVKVSIERPIPAGSIRDSDVYGAQQHTPLLGVVVPDA